MRDKFDVVVIGGGVVGCAIACELSRFSMSVLLLEKEADVARGTSSKNSGVVHTGFNVPPGSLKARLNVEGAAVYEEMCRDLDVPFKRVGKLVVAQDEDQVPDLKALLSRGNKNGVPALEIIDSGQISHLEPRISGFAALHAPTAAITCPYTLTIALAEAAAANGVEVRLGSPVQKMALSASGWTITTPQGVIRAALVVNSAGLHSDKVASMVGVNRWRIYPCRGEYAILDRAKSGLITRMVYPVPPKSGAGLGIHITPTVDGNIILGPSATYIREREDTRTTIEMRWQLLREAQEMLPDFSPADVIAGYSGVRPKLTPENGGSADFIIEEDAEAPGVLHLVGIESPGLTAAPAIASMVAGWVRSKVPASETAASRWPARHSIRFRELPLEAQSQLIENDPGYGQIVCRCELVTKREVEAALANRLGARSLTSVKYRSRAMMGRCQGGFCGPRVVELMLERGLRAQEISLRGGDSWMFSGALKGTEK